MNFFSLFRVMTGLCIGALSAGCAQSTAQPHIAHVAEPATFNIRQQIEASVADHPLAAFGIPLKAEAVLQEFYLERNFQLAWHDKNKQRTPQALAVIQEIGKIGNDGLLPNDYHYTRLQQIGDSANHMEYDLLISDAVANLSSHLLMGKVDPESVSSDWKASRRKRDLVQFMEELTTAENVSDRFLQLRPRQVRYFRLQKLLERLNQEAAPEWPALARQPTIKPNMSDPRLPAIRERLFYWGDLQGEDPATEPTLHDPVLQTAVRRFQNRHGLDPDGVIGAHTIDALNVTPAKRRQQVINNLERWRWLAEDLGEKHVLVNIAGFELKVIENNKTVMRKPVIVGRHYRRTPVFSDRIRYIVFNPTWTVPHKLAVEDKLPDIQADPAYLERLGFTVYDREQNRLDPASIDWSKMTKRNFSYRLVQASGSQNALGQMKFMFPNPYDVYLHDTPSRDLFAKTDRAFSSGCVRVAEPRDLAAWLLETNGITPAQIDEIIAKGELRTVFLKDPIPVHIEYWTAWIDSEDQLNFRNDIYERDPSLAAALAAPLYAK